MNKKIFRLKNIRNIVHCAVHRAFILMWHYLEFFTLKKDLEKLYFVHCAFTLGWHKLDKTQEHSRKLYSMVSVFLPLRGCGLLGWTNVSLESS